MEQNIRYRAAIIGVGRAGARTWDKGGGHQIGYDHARALNALPGTRVTAAADISAANLAAFVEQFEVRAPFADYREMLERERPDIVGICTYVGLHARMILDAARAGVKVILCEKPFVASPAELAAVRAVVAETGVTLGIAHIRRFTDSFVKARELVLGGAVGEPVMLFGGLEGWDLSEFGSHWIDLLRFLRDDVPVVSVFGQARVRELRGYGHVMEDHAIAVFEFADGVRGFVDGGRGFGRAGGEAPGGFGSNDIRVVGTRGVLTVTEGQRVTLINDGGRQVFETPTLLGPWEPLYASLIAQHEGGGESPVSFARCGPSAEINLAAYLSAVKGDRIDLPLAGEDVLVDHWPLDALALRQGSRNRSTAASAGSSSHAPETY